MICSRRRGNAGEEFGRCLLVLERDSSEKTRLLKSLIFRDLERFLTTHQLTLVEMRLEATSESDFVGAAPSCESCVYSTNEAKPRR